MTSLVTGGTGFLGSNLCAHLLREGKRVICLDNNYTGRMVNVAELQNRKSFRFVLHDVCDSFEPDEHLDEIYNLACPASPPAYQGRHSIDTTRTCVLGALNMLELAKAHGARILQASTSEVYGEPQCTPIDEKHPQASINPYGRGKLMIEQIFVDYERAYGLRHISLRYFNAAGAAANGSLDEAHDPETHLIPLVLQAIAGKRPHIKVFGTDYDTPDGSCIRDYIHVEDLTEAHRLALEKLGEYSGCVNLGTGCGTSVLELIHAAEEVCGRPCPVQLTERRPGDPARLFADNTAARSILGWQPRYTDIRSILATAWQWEQHRRF